MKNHAQRSLAVFRASLGLPILVLAAAGATMAVPQAANANPDNSVWYQAPSSVNSQPNQHVSHSNRSRSHRSSGIRVSSGSRYGYSSSRYSRYSCPTYGHSSYRYSSYSSPRYSHSYSSYTPRYSTSYYSRPSVISYPRATTRITYVAPPVQQTQYTSQDTSGAYDAVSYREYQRLLAEQRVLRQQVIDMQRDQEAAAAPTYNPGPAVPSTSPLNQVKGTEDGQVKPDRERSADEILPPVPKEQSVRSESEQQSEAADIPRAWRHLADGNFPSAMAGFTELAGEQDASTADRIGFAIAAASIGQRERAAWAMRRVLIADSDGFGFIPDSDELRTTLKRLASDIGRDAEAKADGPDRRMLMFLTATLDYLSMDMDSGLERLNQARVDGSDHHEGAVQLRRLLEESGASGF
jgi:hypothetical protein